MMLVEPGYSQEIAGRLRERGHDVRHFAPPAEHETVPRRLRERDFGHVLQFVVGKDAPSRRESFAVAKLDRCLEPLRGEEFAEHVGTEWARAPLHGERTARLLTGERALLFRDHAMPRVAVYALEPAVP